MYDWRNKALAVALLVSACAVLLVAIRLQPASCGYGTHTQLGLPACNFLRLSHLPCPSCGLTTSFSHAVRLQIREAFLVSPFGLFAFLATLACIPASIAILRRRISLRSITESARFSRAVYAALAIYLLSWIFKVAQFRLANPGF